jgi:hypothetical protein
MATFPKQDWRAITLMFPGLNKKSGGDPLCRVPGEWLGCAYVTANKLLGQLLALGLLVEVTGQERNRRFSYEPYLQLFSRTKDDPSRDDTTQ